MPTVPFKVKAVFEYKSEEPDDLNFDNGQIITVTAEEDEDWYAGEYVNADGEKVEGIFPKNFVEKYEPAIPTRPARAQKRTPVVPEASEQAPEPPSSLPAHPPTEHHEATEPTERAETHRQDEDHAHKEAEIRSAKESVGENRPADSENAAPIAEPPPPASASKAPPPVAEKPVSSSFRDRIAAFNKPAAAPITPYKPGGSSPSGFIKKPFVAPPPSRNAYVPPPREAPVVKAYRREEGQVQNEPEHPETIDSHTQQESEVDDQPKPQSLKDRIALLQKQQLEQAARSAEKKERPKKPVKKTVEPTESAEQTQTPEAGLSKVDTNETVGRSSADFGEEPHEPTHRHPPRRPSNMASVTPQPQPLRELVSDTNDADDSGAADDEDAPGTSTEEERPKSSDDDQHRPEAVPKDPQEEEAEAANEDEGDEDEDEEEDPEVRRRRELRERMAKMSGGMGMMGMFGGPAPGGLPGTARKPKAEPSRQNTEVHQQEESQERAAPVLMALPGLSNARPKRQEEPAAANDSDEEETAQPTPQGPTLHAEADDYVSQPPQRRSTDRAVPAPPPQERAPPPAPPRESRAAPPPPQSPTSRPPPPIPSARPPAPEELSDQGDEDGQETPEEGATSKSAIAETPASPTDGPPPPPRVVPEPPQMDTTGTSSLPAIDKPTSRPPPPIPGSPTIASHQSRAPPPPPPGFPPSRRSTSDSRNLIPAQPPSADVSDEEEVTEYDGDYDTDIASSAKHKDALKSHNRDSSLDEGILTDDATKPPKSPPTRAVPPLPPVAAPRDVPPPPPPQSAPKSRRSIDAPRSAPPPIPGSRMDDDNDYDPYRYTAHQHDPSTTHNKAHHTTLLQSPKEEVEEEDLYDATPVPTSIPPPLPNDRVPPPPPPSERAQFVPSLPHVPPPPPTMSPRQSLDVKRSNTGPRRSMDQSRANTEQGFIAHDIDLGQETMWWTRESTPPPSLQGRSDILYEMETSSSNKRGGRATISRDIYVLYMDYSQTTINVNFDAADPSHVTFEQNHERPPPAPRRDQLETASSQFGSQMARAAGALLGATVGDGSARALVLELLKPHPAALLPVGTRAYGALVYANLGNASTQQYDEIRPGDIVTFRNAKFSGHKGGLHAKYSVDVGKPEHVAVVIDWDGTKKKIRAWEQGRDLEKGKRSKVREESFKVGDLKSGEVMVWRVMPRTWVGWDSGKS